VQAPDGHITSTSSAATPDQADGWQRPGNSRGGLPNPDDPDLQQVSLIRRFQCRSTKVPYLRNKQQRLLLLHLHHTATCPRGRSCTITPHCADMKLLRQHMEVTLAVLRRTREWNLICPSHNRISPPHEQPIGEEAYHCQTMMSSCRRILGCRMLPLRMSLAMSSVNWIQRFSAIDL
jgi:hypothetical protein